MKIALHEKGIVFKPMPPEDFGNGRHDTPFAAANPRGEVPGLPADAMARMTERVCDTQYESVNWGCGELPWFRRAEGPLADTLKGAARAGSAPMVSAPMVSAGRT